MIPTLFHNIAAVIFDLDGVLLDTEWLAFQAWRHWVEARGGQLDEAAYPGLTGLTVEETAIYVRNRTGMVFDMEESCAWTWQWVLDRVQQGCEPLPGARELVSDLSARGYPLAIASNSTTGHVSNMLSGLGLLEFCPTRVGIDQVARGKPAPDVYLAAARLLETAPHRCLAIEDSRVGVQAAAAAGLRVIAVPGRLDDPRGFTGAWRVYSSLVQVLAELD